MSASILAAEFEALCAQMRREEEIHCPVCGAEYDQTDGYEFVTYWGDDGLKEATCQSCDRDFFVKESVRRTYETAVSERGFE